MNNTTFSIHKTNILLLGLVIIFAILLSSKISQISNKISDIFQSAIVSRGGGTEVLILFAAPVICIVWLWLIFEKKKYLSALILQICIFPLTNKAEKVFAINAYEIPGGFVQKISPSTFLLIMLFFILLYKGLIKRPKDKEGKIFEKFLLLFAIALTTTQLFHHTFHSAMWLSIGCIWQFILLFYILISLITSSDKIVNLYNALLVFVLMNMFLRIFAEKQVYIQQLSGSIQRVGANAMGPAMSYAGYLAIIITICLALYRIKNKKIYIGLIVIFFIELLNTFTRGGFLVLVFLLLIPLWKSERKFSINAFNALIPVVIIFGATIWKYASYRGLSLNSNITKLSNVNIRIELMLIYFKEIFNTSFLGYGMGKGTHILINQTYFSPHNILIEFIDTTGILVTILFLIIFIYSTFITRKYSVFSRYKDNRILLTYTFIALLQWFFFANTTATSLLGYYPYEASSIFWIILFTPFILRSIGNAENIRYDEKCS